MTQEAVSRKNTAPPTGAGVTDHGALTGLTPDDDHPHYALADGSRGTFEAAGAVAAHVADATPHPVFTDVADGLVPASGGGTTNFLRADGTFAVPPGGGSVPTDTGFRHVTGGVEDGAAFEPAAPAILLGSQDGVDWEPIEVGGNLTLVGGVLDGVDASAPRSYSPGDTTVATEEFLIFTRHVKLTTTQRVTLQGTATLRIT